MIRIVCVGKIKEKFYRDATCEYLKRMGKYHKIEIVEVSDSNMKKEAGEILKRLGNKDFVVTLEIEGNKLSSTELSSFIDKTLISNPVITFVIGGSDGLDDEVKKRANYKLSFSKLTFPHQLFRVILLEQIYRSFKIINNETYHK